jgi:predicted ATPase
MITSLELQNFKSWKNPAKFGLSPLTGIFGSNSSGKTSLLQALLILKQTVQSQDRKRVFNTGDSQSLIDIGTFYDVVHNHDSKSIIKLSVGWNLEKPIIVKRPERRKEVMFTIKELGFETNIKEESEKIVVDNFMYSFDEYKFGMLRSPSQQDASRNRYSLTSKAYRPRRHLGRAWQLPSPVKCYGFPDEVNAYYQNLGFLSDIVLEFENVFNRRLAYLGPLREYPGRRYVWAGESPNDVGRKGEDAISALLAAKTAGIMIRRGRGSKSKNIEEIIAEWLKKWGMIDSFEIKKIANNRKDYEVKVRRNENSPEVLITEMGFGVSQLLPVMVLCYYMKEGSTIILEQPEIHLHPAVQAGLADLLIDVVKTRKLQIIVESHSEHLLRRLQRRIAEQKIESKDVCLYFCETDGNKSTGNKLNLDLFGQISNWPKDFFGDSLGDMLEMTKHIIKGQ